MKKKTAHSRRHLFKKHVHSRLLIQLRIFIVIALVMFGILAYDIWQGVLGVGLAGLGILIGLVVGFVIGKFYGIKWHEDTQKVVTRMDIFGVVAIVLYVVFSLFKNKIFGQFIHGPALTAMTFATVGGVMLGRLLAVIGNINKILKVQNII